MLKYSHFPFHASDNKNLSSERIAPIVLLHGWGCDGRIWQPLIPFLNQWVDVIVVELIYNNQTVDSLCEEVAELLPPKSILCGWSLGGMLATRLAASYPEKVVGLITLATNICFISNSSWLQAMPPNIFQSFFDAYQKNSQQGLKRFLLLQVHGDGYAKQQLEWLQSFNDNEEKNDLLEGLKILSSIDNRESFSNVECSALYLFGEKDALVPIACAQEIEILIRQSKKMIAHDKRAVKIFEECGHLLHYPSERIPPAIGAFLDGLSVGDNG